MLDLKVVRDNPEAVRKAMEMKREEGDLDGLLLKDEQRRSLLKEVEILKQERNTVSKQIGQSGAQSASAQQKKEEMRKVSARIKELDDQLRQLENDIYEILLTLPNFPDPVVPHGEGEDDNVEVRSWGSKPVFHFEPKAHWDVAANLDIIDFQRASKISGSRFAVYYGLGARLERALAAFMLDLHTGEHGYREVLPPYLVNADSMTGTGNLPKFAEDAFRVEGKDLYLIPTAEVPVTNLHRDEIIEGEKLPLYYAAFSACFRAEAGAHGRDTRGLIRQHQFSKVELVKFVDPEDSDQELEKLTRDAEKVLQLLGLHYRVMLMCSADLGFAQSKKYDLEVWLPSANTYREISSCSNFTDFQARRAGIRYRPAEGKKTQFVHTINGSGVAIGRTVVAILENYQQADGSVLIPEVLQPYFNGQDRISN